MTSELRRHSRRLVAEREDRAGLAVAGERSRIELSVDGEPGMLAAGVDLGIYRILEDALTAVREQGSPISVTLRFGEEDLELRLIARCHGPSCWPTLAMRERVALCGGELRDNAHNDDGWQFAARMPRGLQGALA
jgi:signal transduction histidine kinase